MEFFKCDLCSRTLLIEKLYRQNHNILQFFCLKIDKRKVYIRSIADLN